MELNLLFIISAFFAGLLTFLAPCTLPLVPAYLGFISGVDQQSLKDPRTVRSARRRICINGVTFILGFSVVFIAVGTLVGFLGTTLVPYQNLLARVGGVFIIVFGFYMLGVFRIPFLAHDWRIAFPRWLSLGNPFSSLFIGGTFALGWTPCVGPILGAILLLAGTSGTAWQGGVLLAFFSLGLAVPFLLIAIAFSYATRYIESISPLLSGVSLVGGIFLIFLGVLLATGNFSLIMAYGYRVFDFIHYERLMDYL